MLELVGGQASGNYSRPHPTSYLYLCMCVCAFVYIYVFVCCVFVYVFCICEFVFLCHRSGTYSRPPWCRFHQALFELIRKLVY